MAASFVQGLKSGVTRFRVGHVTDDMIRTAADRFPPPTR